MKIFLTGFPGSGKSTVLLKIINLLREKKFILGGIMTPEYRKNSHRIGFKIVDIATGKEAIFASIKSKSDFRYGRYGINLYDFENIAISALDYAIAKCDICCIDEIGPIEFLSQKFKLKIQEIIQNEKIIIAVLHRNYVYKFEKNGKIFWITSENRDLMPKKITRIIDNILIAKFK